MKKDELRIGNLLLSNNKIIKVLGLLKDEKIQYYYHKRFLYETDIKEFKPIPLTEEWLIRFGFVIEWYDEGAYYSKKGEYDFDLDGHFDYHRTDGSQIKMEYVHQLQNLYFALTGDELILKK